MTQDDGNQVPRHPDAVAYLEGLGEEGAAVVRTREGGYTRYWLQDGEVRSLDVSEDRPLEALLAAVSAEFGPQLPKLAADLASGVPDLDGVERALRDASLGGGAAALKLLFEQLDRTLPAPECEGCGKPMVRHRTAAKSFLTRLGRVEVERTYFHCRSCGKGSFPLDRALGLEGGAFTPGMASVMAETAPLMSFEAASRHIANLAGVSASSSSLQRWSLALGEEALRFEREEAIAGKPLESRMYLSIDGTGIPMRKEETAGVRGKQEDGSAKSREAKLAVMYTAEGRDPETGAALKDRDSATFSCLIDSAAAASGSTEPSDFARRLGREAKRRGLHDAGEIVVISDGAEWIRSTCDELFGGGKVTFVLDLWHALEYASDAVKAILPEGAERDRRFAEVKADIEAGRAGKVVRELQPFSGRHKDVEDCCRYFQNNIERMRYDRCRDRGMQVGSGVVEAGCRQFGLRLKRSGTRWSERGANAMLALKSCAMNLRVPDFLDWRANQAIAA
ncbi:MAG: ISKra4 family transposase [Alphaproteobacteria bacterium]|nr:ISKra4 family transposase [Alphaproteobacteria bacterium]MDE0523680.1 ISKra4 family transposase [Boseongicola sp.]